MSTLYFRCEGSASIGLGHLYRSSALAKMLHPFFSVCFAINEIAPVSLKEDLKNQYELMIVEHENEFLSRLLPDDGVILDGYNFSSEIQNEIKQRCARLICLDDLHDKHFYADLVINQALNVSETEYSKEPYTRFLLGPQYALLRGPFLKRKRGSVRKVESIFVCFGGSDYNNITLSLLQLLEEADRNFLISVVLGPSFEHYNIIEKYSIASKNEIRIFQNQSAEDLASLIRDCDLAFVPCSSILLEVLSVGVPAIGGFYTDNQLDIYNSYLKQGLIISGGDYRKIRENKNLLLSLEHTEFPEVQRCLNYFDGKSPNRIKKEIIRLFFPTSGSIRQASILDCQLLFEWVNDPDTRKNSIHSETISWKEHNVWLKKQLANDNISIRLYIVEFNGLPVGQIRFNLNNDFWDITYAVAPDFRGLGFGELIVRKGLEIFPIKAVEGKKFRAFVRKQNIASLKVFEKNHFERVQSVQIAGSEFIQFKHSF